MRLYNLSDVHVKARESLEEDSENKPYFTIIGHITQFPDKMFYLSCDSPDCKKKVAKDDDDSFICYKCDSKIV